MFPVVLMRRGIRAVVAVGGAMSLLAVFTVLVAPGASASDDPLFDSQWPLAQIGAPEAWAVSRGAGVTIGIVDTGVDVDHPDLRSKIDAHADCVGGTCRLGEGRDRHGHGTLVSGIAAASTGNRRGVAGVAPEARLVVARAVDAQGRGSVDDIAAGIRWVVDQGAHVVNLSLGDPNFLFTSLVGTPLAPAIEAAWANGAIPVLAAGNENVGLLGLGSSNYGQLNAVIVGATARTGEPASYSSPIGNAKWGLVAPGGSGTGPPNDVLSTYAGGEYAWTAGTSMAAPHVSGALALLLAGGLSREAAVERMLATADRTVSCGSGCRGRLDLRTAVASLPTTAPAPTAAPPTSAAPAVPAPPTTTAPTPSTSVAPPTSLTRPAEGRTTAPEPAPAGQDGELAGGFDLVPESGDRDRSTFGTAPVLAALALLVSVWSGVTAVAYRRLTGAGGW